MPLRELERFSISHLQVLDEKGNLDSDLEPKLGKDELIRVYRAMLLAREADQRMLKLQRQGRLGTFAPCTGQEAAVCGPTLAMSPRDWFVGAFREFGGRLMRGESLAQALLFYAVGLWAFSVIRVIDSAFFSIQDRKSPLKAAFVALFVNVAMSLILMFPLQHGGLALATSLASMVNVTMLAFILQKRIGTFLDGEFYRSLGKTAISSLAMGVVLLLVGHFLPWHSLTSFPVRLGFLAVSITLGMLTFLASAYLTGNAEMMMVVAALKRRTQGSVRSR